MGPQSCDGAAKILIIGAGYVAQHLIAALKDAHDVAFTHRRAVAPFAVAGARAIFLDLADDDSIAAALWDARPDVVINCAAMASPKHCELDEAAAFAANCPLGLLEALHAAVPDALLIHFSTDLVLAGASPDAAPYGDGGASPEAALEAARAAEPENAYGRSKLAFEAALARGWPRCIVLRMSNVLGPPAPFDGSGKFAQWVRGELAAQRSVDLWRDEARSFVAVSQVVAGVRAAVARFAVAHTPADDVEARLLAAAAFSPSETAKYQERARRAHPPVFLHLNCGGPEAVDRAALGRAAARVLGVDELLVRAQFRPKDMATPAPLRVALDSGNFAAELGVRLVPLEEALAEALL